ncbi:hypothetical protein A2U01_0042134 [Trifolium medium]|uniref:Uncharacterized protein n=1 Tax=Trifolium medium TaxID=97028 RepID=A0A392QB69_9FABA|nr:hypothetical protein [Trifolium medium]
MISFLPFFSGYGATIACGFAVVYTGGGVDTDCGLSWTVGSFSVVGSILSSGSSSTAYSIPCVSFVEWVPAWLTFEFLSFPGFSTVSTFLLRSSIALLCSSFMLEISFAKC